MSVIQLIDEAKRFSPEVGAYLERLGVRNAGLDYDVVAVFGSQSTGKSTLLNALFGTEFGVMDAMARRQTTKGIWMGAENAVDGSETKPLLVLDVEGTDGRERGEDQDFERKAALFALATSETLIINMWEHQVGLYVGANMALLRTVFEVNLSLFQAGRGSLQRSRLLFAIRDYIGITPLTALAQTLTEDLERQWAAISKPAELADSKLTDFFDLDFVGLPNKMLQREEFATQVQQMLAQLKANFHEEYHRKVPLDGWPLYAEQVWQQIELNKDLDLPTHQMLVARFRCEEIAAAVFAEFETCVNELNLPFGESVVISGFGEVLRELRTAALGKFDDTAGKYTQSVYTEKRLDLLGKIDGMLSAFFTAQLNALIAASVAEFQQGAKTGSGQFKERVETALAQARTVFSEGASDSVIDASFYSVSGHESELETQLAREARTARELELQRELKRAAKRLAQRLDPVDLHFNNYPEKLATPWDAIDETLRSAIIDIANEHPDLGGDDDEIARSRLLLHTEAWRVFANKIGLATTPDAVLSRMRDRFEDDFKYTPDGLPIVWNPGDDIASKAAESRRAALRLLPVFSRAQLSSGETLAVPENVAAVLREAEEDVPEFDVLLTSAQQEEVQRRFQRHTDSAFVDAQRSVLQLTTRIPPYIYAIIAVLGWNEFMLVLRNPLLILFVLMLAGAAYIIHNLGMTNHVRGVAANAIDGVVKEGKVFLRKHLFPEEERRRARSSSGSASYFGAAANGRAENVGLSPVVSPRSQASGADIDELTVEDRVDIFANLEPTPVPESNLGRSSTPVVATARADSVKTSVPEPKLASAFTSGPAAEFAPTAESKSASAPATERASEAAAAESEPINSKPEPTTATLATPVSKPLHHVTLEDVGEF